MNVFSHKDPKKKILPSFQQNMLIYIYIYIYNALEFSLQTKFQGIKYVNLIYMKNIKRPITSDPIKKVYIKRALLMINYLGPAVRVFANGPGDLGSIPGRVIPKTLKMELDTTLLNTQHYKVQFKGKVEQSREWSNALPYTLV